MGPEGENRHGKGARTNMRERHVDRGFPAGFRPAPNFVNKSGPGPDSPPVGPEDFR